MVWRVEINVQHKIGYLFFEKSEQVGGRSGRLEKKTKKKRG